MDMYTNRRLDGRNPSELGRRRSRRGIAVTLGVGLIVTSAGILGLGSIAPASASTTNLACDGGFESPVVPAPSKIFKAGQTIGCWTVGTGSVDLDHSSAAAEGSQYVDMDGSFADGEVHQNLTTTAGAVYAISFKLAGNTAGAPVVKTVVVTFGSTAKTYTFDTTGHTATNPGWQTVVFTAPASTSSTRLSIKSTDAPNGHNSYGALIDDVTVTS